MTIISVSVSQLLCVLAFLNGGFSFLHSAAKVAASRRGGSASSVQMSTISSLESGAEHAAFLTNIAKTKAPKRLDTLLELQKLKGEELLKPTDRKDLNPFLIPLSRDPVDKSLLCYIRWPTQKDDMDLQLVRTTSVGIQLVSMGTDQYCHRLAAELDFFAVDGSSRAIEAVNKHGKLYSQGDYLPFLKSGKFPALTKDDLRLVIDRFLLTKVGAFPDCFERLATSFLKSGADVSALVTSERAVSVFYGWGHPLNFHAKMMAKIPGREAEARDAARAALNMPVWTVASSAEDLDSLAKLAGFSGSAILGEMHAYRSNDPRTDEVGEGLSPCQVTLDQAAHLMDAIALGNLSGWEIGGTSRALLSQKYKEGGYPEIAEFIMS